MCVCMCLSAVAATLTETRQFYTLYNTLEDQKAYMEKEVWLVCVQYSIEVFCSQLLIIKYGISLFSCIYQQTVDIATGMNEMVNE